MTTFEDIISASKRIEPYINHTPVHTSRTLNEIVEANVYIKCENFQRMGAFKFRGACNALLLLDDESKKKGIVTHSSGNHAQAVALAGKLLGLKTVIVMPNNAPQVKVDATKGYGAEVVFSEPDVVSRERACNKLIQDCGYTLIHPYDNETVIQGAGTASFELVEEIGQLDLLIVPVGGGGLISGSSIYAKGSEKVVRVLGAEPENADDAHQSFHTKILVKSHTPDTIADGLRTVLSERTFGYIRKNVDDIITVSETEIVEAMKFLWERMKIIVEPSGATPLAVVFKLAKQNKIVRGSKIGLILSGGNVDLSSFFDQYKHLFSK